MPKRSDKEREQNKAGRTPGRDAPCFVFRRIKTANPAAQIRRNDMIQEQFPGGRQKRPKMGRCIDLDLTSRGTV